MNDVRRKGSGTWDRTQERWELKKLGIRKTPKQLADILGEPVPEGKIASRQNWEKYLTYLTTADNAEKRKRSHLQERLRSLEVIIRSLRAESRNATEFISYMNPQ